MANHLLKVPLMDRTNQMRVSSLVLMKKMMEMFFPDDKFNIFPNLIFQTAFISQLKFWLASCYLYLWFKNCARHILKEGSFFQWQKTHNNVPITP